MKIIDMDEIFNLINRRKVMVRQLVLELNSKKWHLTKDFCKLNV